jgi:hypothetical protein
MTDTIDVDIVRDVLRVLDARGSRSRQRDGEWAMHAALKENTDDRLHAWIDTWKRAYEENPLETGWIEALGRGDTRVMIKSHQQRVFIGFAIPLDALHSVVRLWILWTDVDRFIPPGARLGKISQIVQRIFYGGDVFHPEQSLRLVPDTPQTVDLKIVNP